MPTPEELARQNHPLTFYFRISTFYFRNAIHHLAPYGMAGFVLVRFCFWVKLKAARVFKSLDNSTPASFRERRRWVEISQPQYVC
jgi:hypothetical protein